MHGYGPHKIRTAKNLQGCILGALCPPSLTHTLFLGDALSFRKKVKKVGALTKKWWAVGGALKSGGTKNLWMQMHSFS